MRGDAMDEFVEAEGGRSGYDDWCAVPECGAVAIWLTSLAVAFAAGLLFGWAVLR